MRTLPAKILQDIPLRHERLRHAMHEAGADAMLLTMSSNMIYAAGTVVYGWLYLPQNGNAHIFYRRPADLPQRLPGIQCLHVLRPDQIAAGLADAGLSLPGKLLLEGDELPAAAWFQLARIFRQAELLNGSGAIRAARAVKTACELELLRESCRRHAAVTATFPSLYRPGMSDTDYAIAMEHAVRQAGSLGLMRAFGGRMEIFMGSVLSGDNANSPAPYDFALGGSGINPTLPIGANGTPLQPGTTVMADISGNFTGYISDCSRTYAIGAIPANAARAHNVSIAICEALAAAGKPGARCDDLYALALRMAEEAGLADHFMGHAQQAKFVGHGLGIEINELPILAPRVTMLLQKNMTIALEPKFVFPGIGAVGIENTYAVTENGLEKLTHCDETLQQL